MFVWRAGKRENRNVEDELALGLAAVIIFGVGGQWLAGRMKVPSILVLLIAGVLAGPVTHLVEPEELFGELLFPLVGIAVAILLFEGGLSLRVSDFSAARSTVVRLVTVGVAATWMVGALAALALFDLSMELAFLLGAILTVSGPTVVIPLLRQARPRASVGSVLRWEGIVIDPIGAVLAVVVLKSLLAPDTEPLQALADVAATGLVGTSIGIGAAGILALLLRSFTVPDHLQNPVAMMFAVASFTLANGLQSEAGLFAATALGIALANQRIAPTSHIVEFQEELGPLVLASLFIVLGARVDLDAVSDVVVPAVIFAAVLAFIARPLCVWLSTIGAGFEWRERLFLASMAPRGIVAAAVASLFSLELAERGIAAESLVPITFVVIVTTVIFSATLALPLASLLNVAKPKPNGIALIGSQPWTIALAEALAGAGVSVLVVSPDGVEANRLSASGVALYDGRLSSHDFLDQLDEHGISEAIAMSRNEELNSYAVSQMVEVLDRRNVFHLPPHPSWQRSGVGRDRSAWGRRPFHQFACQEQLEKLVRDGASFVVRNADVDPPGPDSQVLFTVNESGTVEVFHEGQSSPTLGSQVIALEMTRAVVANSFTSTAS